MYAIQKAKQQVLQEIKQAVDQGYSPSIDELATPPDKTMGDIAFPCFVLAKKSKRNPAEIATELAAKIGPTELISKVEAAGPYVNFRLNDEAFTQAVLGEVAKMDQQYGHGTSGKGVKVLIEGAPYGHLPRG